jgi:flagellar protein FliO/FliZ
MQLADYLNFAIALALVVALILGLSWLVKRFGLGGPLVRGMPVGSGGRRLAVVEVLTLDARRKMVLVKRDQQEHLLLLGANDDLVIESVAREASEA